MAAAIGDDARGGNVLTRHRERGPVDLASVSIILYNLTDTQSLPIILVSERIKTVDRDGSHRSA